LEDKKRKGNFPTPRTADFRLLSLSRLETSSLFVEPLKIDKRRRTGGKLKMKERGVVHGLKISPSNTVIYFNVFLTEPDIHL